MGSDKILVKVYFILNIILCNFQGSNFERCTLEISLSVSIEFF